MRIERLAQIFKFKLLSEATTPAHPMVRHKYIQDAKRDLLSAYKVYVSSDAKDPILQILASMNESFAVEFVGLMESLISKIDKMSGVDIFYNVNRLLGMINNVKNDPDKKVRNFLHDSIKVNKQSDKNYREHIKSKFEMVLYRLSGIFERIVNSLKKVSGIETPLEGELVSLPQRKELSKDKIMMFMRSPAAEVYKLDDPNVMEKILLYPETREKLTKLINAIDRGQISMDAPEVMEEAQSIKKWLNNKKTNFEEVEL